MYKIHIISVGKHKEGWLQEALALYEERLRGVALFEWSLLKQEQLEPFLKKQTCFFCLDPNGKQYTSEEFSSSLTTWLEQSGSRLSFVIGGAEGIAPSIKKRALGLISFSKMTLTHQITRLLLLEQIYRALEIARGSAYHK